MIRSAGVALVAALALALAGRVAAAESELAVDVTVAGTPDDVEHVRGLAVSLPFGARVRWLGVGSFDPATVIADATTGDAAVRIWIDLTDSRRARLYFATQSERFLVRDVVLSGRFDEVDRAALSEVLELSVGALTDNERAGLTRDEAQALLAGRAPPSAAPLPISPPLPPPANIPSRWAAGAFYGAQAPSGDSPIAQGPGLLLTLAHDPRGQRRGQGTLFWVSGQWNTLDTAGGGGPIGVGLDTIAARAGIEVGSDSGVGLRAGMGVDFIHIAPRALEPGPSLELSRASWSADLVVSAAARVNLSVIGRARLAGLFVLDFVPTAVSYDVATNGALSPVYTPGRLRPGIAIELHLHHTSSGRVP